MGLFFNKKPNALICIFAGHHGIIFKERTQLGFTPSKALGGPYSSFTLGFVKEVNFRCFNNTMVFLVRCKWIW
jgi:hypothetical protein